MESGQDRLEEILAEALAKRDPKARADYLDKACAGDQSLRAKVGALIQAYEKGGAAVEKTLVVTPALNQERPGTVIGRYKLLQEIGEGGFGLVFMAEQFEPVRRKVALKIIKAGMDTREVIARFEAERQALALMDHPNIARVLDAGATESGRPYFVMELVKGVKVTDYCDQHNLSTEERLGLFIKVCHAVQHAHQKGIIHRDLKPSNVMVTLHDGEAVPKVIDFGIAKATGQRLTEKTLFTRYEQMIGTPAYMSPEQAAMSGLDVDTRTDIYALGVLLYELLTGVTPFDKETLAKAALDEIRRMIRETEPPKPSTRLHTMGEKLTEVAKQRHAEPGPLRRSVRGDLDWIVMKALEKDRTRRYETANAFAEDIQRHLHHEPVAAGPPGAAYRASKFARRHRVGVGMAAVVALALALGLVASLLGFSQARRERNRAVAAEREVREERDRAVAAEHQTERERNTAELLAAETALAEGQRALEAGKGVGLLDFVEAFDLAKHNPAFQEAVGRRWSTWHEYWDRLTIAVRPMVGTPSPDYLQYASVLDWPPLNTSRVVHVYDTLSHTRVIGPLEHDSVAVACAFSADGRLLATLTKEGVIHFWDRRTGAPARPPCPTGVAGLESLAFSPCGRYVVAFSVTHGTGPSTAPLVILDRPSEPARLLEHPYPLNGASFSPEGELLAILCKPRLQLWRTSDARPVGPPATVSLGHLLAFSPDGKQLAFEQPGASAIGLLDPATLQVVRSLPKEDRDAWSAAYSHNGLLLAWIEGTGVVDIRNPCSGEQPLPPCRLGGRLQQPAFNPDDSLMAVGDAAGTIHVVSTENGRTVAKLHARPFAKPTFLTNGVLAGYASAYISFWDLGTAPLPGQALPDDALACALEFDNSGKFLAVGSEGELRLWQMQPSPAWERAVPLPGRVLALTYSGAHGQFAAFTDDGSLTLVDPHTGRPTPVGNYGRGYELSASLSPDGRKLALYRYLELLIVNTSTGTIQPIDREGGPLSVAFRRDSARMAVGLASWNVSLYDTSTETNNLVERGESLGGWAEAVAFHPQGSMLGVFIGQSGLRLYESYENRTIGTVRKPALIRGLLARFSEDGRLLAVAGPTSVDRDATTPVVPAPLVGITGPTARTNDAVELWHVDPQRGLFFTGVHLTCDRPVWSLAFAPDNSALVVGGMGTTRLWRLPSLPKDLGELRSRTWATLGWRRNERGELVYSPPSGNANQERRARLTQARASSDSPLDAALKLPPPQALAALQQLTDQHPETKAYRNLLGRLHAELVTSAAEQGLWTQALIHADDALRLRHDDPYTRYQRALACLGAGDAAGHRATCQAMVERYKSSNDPAILKWVGWSVAVAPGALDDYAGLIEQLRRAASRIGGPHGPAYRFYLGAVLARGGRYDEAVAEFEQVNRHLRGEGAFVDFSPVYCDFLLATCHAHLGNDAEARQWYEIGSADARNLLKPGQEGTATTGTTSWNRRLTLRLLQAEAESLLKVSPQPPTPSR